VRVVRIDERVQLERKGTALPFRMRMVINGFLGQRRLASALADLADS